MPYFVGGGHVRNEILTPILARHLMSTHLKKKNKFQTPGKKIWTTGVVARLTELSTVEKLVG